MLTARGQPKRLANVLGNTESKMQAATMPEPLMPIDVRGGALRIGYDVANLTKRNAIEFTAAGAGSSLNS